MAGRILCFQLVSCKWVLSPFKQNILVTASLGGGVMHSMTTNITNVYVYI